MLTFEETQALWQDWYRRLALETAERYRQGTGVFDESDARLTRLVEAAETEDRFDRWMERLELLRRPELLKPERE